MQLMHNRLKNCAQFFNFKKQNIASFFMLFNFKSKKLKRGIEN